MEFSWVQSLSHWRVCTFSWTDHFSNNERRGMTHLFNVQSRLRDNSAAWREKVLFLQPTKKKVQLLGIKDGSEELIIGTPSGCLVCPDVKRRPREDGSDLFFTAFLENPEIFCCHESRSWELTYVPSILTFFFRDRRKTRRVYIRNSVDLARYGYTARCLGCDAATV